MVVHALIPTLTLLLLAVLPGNEAGGTQAEPCRHAMQEEAQRVNILELTSINYRRGKPLPEEVQELNGKRIRIGGYMALGTLEGIQRFELVPEPCECGRSKIQHFVDVTMSEGLTTYIPGRIELEGIFSCGEVEEDGFVVSLYRLHIKSLQPGD